MTEIDYTAIGLISMLSGFGGAIGGELARAVINYVKEKAKQ
jgi:hypothetical protein